LLQAAEAAEAVLVLEVVVVAFLPTLITLLL
jgi:hypothetical protein